MMDFYCSNKLIRHHDYSTVHTLQSEVETYDNIFSAFSTKYFLPLSCPHSFLAGGMMAGDNFIAHFPVRLCVSSRLWPASVRPSSPGPDPVSAHSRAQVTRGRGRDPCYHVDTVRSIVAVKSDGELMDL